MNHYFKNNLLSFDRNEQTTAAIFEMFFILEKMELEVATVFCGDKKRFILIAKDPIDVIKLDFAHSEFYTEFITWFYGFPNRIKKPLWILDDQKTQLFITCIKTSVKYYLLHKQKLFSFRPKNDLVELFCNIFSEELKDLRFHQN